MDILYPVCKFKGSISDDLIPEQGKHVSCPKCRAKIFIKKSLVSLTTGKTAATGSSAMELVSYDKAILDDVAGPEVKVFRARCANCGGDIKVPGNKKVLLCPSCGTTIVRHVVEEDLVPMQSESFVDVIGESFGSVFAPLRKSLKRRRVRRVLSAGLALLALLLVVYGIRQSKKSPDSIFNKKIDVTFKSPLTEEEKLPEDAALPERESGGFWENLVQIEVTSPEEQVKEEVRIYQIVFKDGTRSGFFRYYRYDGGLVYITLPDGKGGYYEQEYNDADVHSIKRVWDLPSNVKVYGVN